ncbi:3D domain-containing protein [[Clostridium] dakarense]|uniref:3D domain-containing protein n=1 Tax=Faecalimicrobium dakarense TaxID=1301100 RepID=UPI0004B1D27B|nr:3D domain-containing protein [[Clostridium] dakarense]
MKRKFLMVTTAIALLFMPNVKAFADSPSNTENTSINIQSTKNGYINATNVNFRTGPSTESKVNYTLDKSESIDIIGTEGKWTKVSHKDSVGYVYSKYVSYNEEKETVSLDNSKKLNVKATAYAGDTITSTGTVPKWGTIAVDPTVIPYGTKVYIPKFDKVFVAEDTGSAIKGNRIDIFMATEKDCNEWGVKNIDIHVLP